MLSSLGLAILLAAPAPAGPDDCTPPFVRDASYGAGDRPVGVALGDLDRDGHLDAVAASSGDSEDLTVHLGRADGTFAPATSVPLGAPARVVGLADLDHDGRLDAAVGCFTNFGALRILRGRGDGTFEALATYDAGRRAWRLRIADVNDDHHPDVLVLGQRSTDVSVCLGRGDGTFEAPFAYGVLSKPTDLAVGDVDGDGVLDLVASSFNDYALSILRGRGDGTFEYQRFLPIDSPTGLAVVDVDGDDDHDLLVSDFGAVQVLANDGAGSFEEIGAYEAEASGWLVAEDFDGDGVVDVAVGVYRSTGTISVLRGRGDGTFDETVEYGVGNRPYEVVAGDLNGDGAPDLVHSESGPGTIGVLLNRCACPADFDADGVVGFEDLLSLLEAWGPCYPCRQDLDVNYVVNFEDLLALLDAWGPC